MLLPLIAAATAAEPAHYHPENIAAQSQTFARFAQVAGPRFEELQQQLAGSARAIDLLDTSVNLLGDRAPAELVAYRDGLRSDLARGYLEAQSHVSWFEEASSSVFLQALDLQLKSLESEYTLTRCKARSGIGAITGPGASLKSCEGTDLNAQIAGALDSSQQLSEVVDQLVAEPWPTVAVQGTEQPVVPWLASEDYVQLAVLERKLAGKVQRLNEALDDDLAPLEEALADTSSEAGQQALADAEELRGAYEAEVAQWGATLLAALEKPLKKKKLLVGLCANPEALGGCVGTDRTADVIEAVKGDKKVQKALQ